MNSPQAGELPALPEPIAELHWPETEFEDGTWHKPLAQGWAGGVFVFDKEQMHAFRAEGIAAALAGLPEQEAVGEVDGEGHVTFFDPIPEGGAKLYAAPPGDERAPTAQAPWPIRGVRVDGDTIVIKVRGGNDAARWLCGEILAQRSREERLSTDPEEGAKP